MPAATACVDPLPDPGGEDSPPSVHAVADTDLHRRVPFEVVWGGGPADVELGVVGLDRRLDATHAEHMARTIYAGRACFTVGREIQPWRFVNRGADELSDEVAR